MHTLKGLLDKITEDNIHPEVDVGSPVGPEVINDDYSRRAFSKAESKKDILNLAHQVLGDKRKAMRWLSQPQIALGGRIPIKMLSTRKGMLEVQNLLGRIMHGIVL